jgi:GT2 family glycosyltransferase
MNLVPMRCQPLSVVLRPFVWNILLLSGHQRWRRVAGLRALGAGVELRCCREISVVILSYNRRDDLRTTLAQLLVPDAPWHEVIVADNASSDGTPDMIRRSYPAVRLVETGGNHGIVGSNKGYLAATGRWVLSLDDDSHPFLPSWQRLSPMLDADQLTGERVAAVSLSVRSVAPVVTTSTAAPTSTLQPAFGFSSAGVLFSRDALLSIGVYDPELFLFTNELHWTARALEMGWRLLKCDEACVIHRAVPLQRSSIRHAFYYCRNLLLFTLRHAPATEVREQLARQLADVGAFSLLHGTRVYLKAAREAWRMSTSRQPERPRLLPEQLRAMNIDWRVPYGYLG